MTEADVSESHPPSSGRIAGFWLRAISDGIDAAILALAGLMLVWFIPGPLAALGEQGAFVGLTLGLAYHGVLQSDLAGGRTLGKRLLGLTVRRPDGRLLSLERSLVRYGLLASLFYGGHIVAALTKYLPGPLRTPTLALLLGVGAALFVGCVLLVIGHPLKRGLHDLCADSIVVRGGMPPARRIARNLRSQREQAIIVGAFLVTVVVAVTGFVMTRALDAWDGSTSVADDANRIGLDGASAVELTTSSQQGTRRVLLVSGFVRRAELTSERRRQLHDAIVEVVRRRVPKGTFAAVHTTMRTGINLGVYVSYTTFDDETPLAP